MEALDIITLDAAKYHLVLEGIDDYDAQVTGLIETAIAMVEQYTGYYLYQRVKKYPIVSGSTAISDFPLQITGISDAAGVAVSSFAINITQGALTTYVQYWGWFPNCVSGSQPAISALVGYVALGDIPNPLIAAAYKLITYLFQNKDMYEVTMPYDVQLLLNQWRRSASI